MPKLARAVHAAEDLGAPTVVVHPPFRWQRYYVDAFDDIVGELEDDSGVAIAVENMFPDARRPAVRRGERSARRLSRRGGGRARRRRRSASRSTPPTTATATTSLDLSHTAMAGADAQAMFSRMGTALTHLHLADGSGAATTSTCCRVTAPSRARRSVAGWPKAISTARWSWRSPRVRHVPNRSGCDAGAGTGLRPDPSGTAWGIYMSGTCMSELLTAVRALTRRPGDRVGVAYWATIDPVFTIGPKVHGGSLQMIAVGAARAAFTELAPMAGGLVPVAIASDYLAAPNPESSTSTWRCASTVARWRCSRWTSVRAAGRWCPRR